MRAASNSGSGVDAGADFDFVRPARAVRMRLLSGRGHYDEVVRGVMEAKQSVWIATANLKELMVEDARAVPGRARTARARYRSVLDAFDELASRRVELRILHATTPSRAFREELARHPQLLEGGLVLRACSRVHFKAVVIDGARVYLGSANWTGAGLGAKGTGRRNFEIGIVSEDDLLLDEVQGLYDRVWRGAGCRGCRVRDVCAAPLDGSPATSSASNSIPQSIGRRRPFRRAASASRATRALE